MKRGVTLAVCLTVFSAVAETASLHELQSDRPRPLELEDYFRIEDIHQPAISPDGRWVALVRTYILEDDNRRQSEIWLAPTDGRAPPVRLTSPAYNSTAPLWSPDGALLAFTSRRDVPGKDSKEISSYWFLRMESPGGEAFQIEGVGGTPVFSPDNRWIAFTKKTPPDGKSEGQPLTDFEREVTERFEGHIYDWMSFRFDRRGYLPDPRDPAATPPEELYVVPRVGGSPTLLTHLGVNVQSPVWSPDSRRLAWVADSHQRDEYVYERADVWLADLDGRIRRLTDDGYHHRSPAWSPDGRFLVFRRMKGLNLVIEAKQDHGAPVDVFRMAAEGGSMENLTSEWDLRPGEPRWSPDGRFIYFEAGIRGNSHLFRVPVSEGGVEQVTRGISLSSSGERLAYAATDSARPSEIFSARVDGSDERKITGFHDALVEEVQLSVGEPILYPSKDGTEIEGWILLPPGYPTAQGPYPLILSIHGGPHGAYGNRFSFQFQLWAATGYAVLYTNPRGSTGYGENFLYATWGGWGSLDFDDVMAGVDAALKQYAFDEKRCGVTGYSYGGFLTNWAIGHTSRFKAAICGAGISNWVSDYGTADIPRTKESEFYGPPWEARGGELLRKQSPIAYAGRVTTPTLFIHGESDFRVPIEQGEQMYTALKKRSVPAKFVRYPNSYHGGWSPWNTLHRYYQELVWWEKHLRSESKVTN